MKKTLIAMALTALAASAFADDSSTEAQAQSATDATVEQCQVVIEGNDQMRYNIEQFSVNKEACSEFTINFKNAGKLPKNAMGHNVVITKTSDVDAVAADGIKAGLDNDYIKPGDVRIITHTKLIGGGEETSVTFETDKLDQGGDYTFFCSFPGHHGIMHGKVNVE